MLWLSEVLIQNPEVESYTDLEKLIKAHAHNGEVFFRMDVKPPYPDTPDNWEMRLEGVFTSALDHPSDHRTDPNPTRN